MGVEEAANGKRSGIKIGVVGDVHHSRSGVDDGEGAGGGGAAAAD